jgi:hypothetical protein
MQRGRQRSKQTPEQPTVSGIGTEPSIDPVVASEAPEQPPERRRSGFPSRRLPTEAELAEARDELTRILGMRNLELTPSQIARVVGLPVDAIEVVLSEAPPESKSRSSIPAPAPTTEDREAPPPRAPTQAPSSPEPSPVDGPYVNASVEGTLFAILREHALTEPHARGVCRRFSHLESPADFDGLERILVDFGVRPSIRSSIVESFKGETGSAGHREITGDPLTNLRRETEARRAGELRELMYRAEKARLERELSPPAPPAPTTPPALSAELELSRKLREENEQLKLQLTAEKHAAEMRGLEQRLQQQINEIRSSTRAPSLEESESMARADVLRHLGDRLSKTGAGQQLAHDIIGDPALRELALRQVRDLASEPNPDRDGIETRQPTEAELVDQVRQMARSVGAGPAPPTSAADAEFALAVPGSSPPVPEPPSKHASGRAG